MGGQFRVCILRPARHVPIPTIQAVQDKKKSIHYVIGYDQSGNRINKLERGDSWVNNKTFHTSTKRLFVSGDSNGEPGTRESVYTVALNDMHDDSSRLGDINISGMVNQQKERAPDRGRPDDGSTGSDFHSQNGQNFRYL